MLRMRFYLTRPQANSGVAGQPIIDGGRAAARFGLGQRGVQGGDLGFAPDEWECAVAGV
jgi:hypothetical protein